MSRRDRDEQREKEIAALPDLDVDSEFGRTRQLARERGTPEGVDPQTGERAAVTFRQLFNETGDEAAAKEIFYEVAQAGGFGHVELNQSLDVRSLGRSVKAHNKSADDKIDPRTGRDLDNYAIHQHRQAAQHQDRLVNAVGEALERLRKG